MSENRRTKVRHGDRKRSPINGQSEPLTVPKYEDLDNSLLQERIQEKLSISVPMPKLAPSPKPFWQRYLRSKVRLQLKDGTEIGGILKEILWDWIKLENVLEIGKDYRLNADWVMVDASTVSRFYPATAQVE